MLNEATERATREDITRFYTILRYFDNDRILPNQDRIKRFEEMFDSESDRLIIMINNILRAHKKIWEQEVAGKKPDLKVVEPIQLTTKSKKKEKEKEEAEQQC